MAVTKRARFEVFRRDGHRCTYCGTSAEDGAKLTIDHVTPVSLGGSDIPANLVTACRDCNAGKSSVPVDAPLVASAAGAERKWKGALAQAAQDSPLPLPSPLPAPRRTPRKALPERVIGEDDERERSIQGEFSAEWRRWKTPDGRTLPLPASWRGNIVGLVRSGLPVDEMLKFVGIAMNAKTKGGDDSKWRYFCGCCWRRIEQLQDRAQETLAEAHACKCADEHGRDASEDPHDSQAECAAYAEGTSCGYSAGNADRTSGDAVSRDLNRRAILDLLAVASAAGGASAHDLDSILADGVQEVSLPSGPRNPAGWVEYLRKVIQSAISTEEITDSDCGHCESCADRRSGETDTEECARAEPCPHCTDPTCNYQAGLSAGIQDGMEYEGSRGRYRAERDFGAFREASRFVHAVADLMPDDVRSRVGYISVATAGETSLQELARRQAAGELAGEIDIWAWHGTAV